MTKITTKFFSNWRSPNWKILEICRNIIKNNGISFIDLEVETNETFLPKILVELGCFVSNTDVRKKRPEFFKEVDYDERVKVGKINLYFYPLNNVFIIEDMFEGNIEQFRECFFEAHNIEEIKLWADKEGYVMKVRYDEV